MSRKTRRVLAVSTAGGLSLLLAAPAFAAVSGTSAATEVTYVGDGAADNFAVGCTGGNVAPAPAPAVTCAALTRLSVDLGGAVDLLDLTAVTRTNFPALLKVDVDSADGDAELVNTTPLDDIVVADAGDTVNTGDGADRITGGASVNGGDGNNRFVEPFGAVAGGQGTDTVEFDYTDAPDTATNFSVTGASTGAGTYAVNGASRSATSIDSFVLSMPDGINAVSDVNSASYTGRVVVRLHSGADTFTGGSGDDVVDAGPGTDVVNPGTGRDSVQGGEGADSIFTQDGEVDTVDCGDGVDSVVADRGDTLRNCETVSLPALPPPAPPTAPETSQVVGLKKVTRGTKASFVFVASDSRATFECRVDNKAWRSCTSPFKLNTRKQKVGKHKVFVRATLNGVVDATPSKFGFRVTKPKRR